MSAGADAGAAAEASPAREVPSTAATLSWVTPGDAGTCVWMRSEPVADAQAPIASVPEPCDGARFAWPREADAGVALLWFDPGARGGSTLPGAAYPSDPTRSVEPSGRVYELAIATGEARALPMLPTDAGVVHDVAFSGASPTALLLQPLDPTLRDSESVTVGGEKHTFDAMAEGLPALAHAFRLKGGKWQRVETKPTDEGSDGSQGVRVLEAAGELGTRSADLLLPHAQGDAVEDEDALRRLSPFKPEEGEGGWIFLGSSAGRFYVWEEQIEVPFTMGRVVFAVAGADGGERFSVAPELGFTPKDFVAVRSRGPYVLVSEADSGRHPRLYDAATGKLVWKSDTAWATTFWPNTFVETPEHTD